MPLSSFLSSALLPYSSLSPLQFILPVVTSLLCLNNGFKQFTSSQHNLHCFQGESTVWNLTFSLFSLNPIAFWGFSTPWPPIQRLPYSDPVPLLLYGKTLGHHGSCLAPVFLLPHPPFFFCHKTLLILKGLSDPIPPETFPEPSQSTRISCL